MDIEFLITTIKLKDLLFILIALTIFNVHSQYDYEKYPAIKYQKYSNWKIYDWSKTKRKINFTITIKNFYSTGDNLTIQLTSFSSKNKNSIIRIFKNKQQIQKITEIMRFNPSNVQFEPVRIADINGDGLNDIKINIPYMGNGLAAMNYRIIYLFQTENGKFIKISFDDKMEKNRKEYDFDNDGNYEIITSNLINYKNHNYWTFNIFEFNNEKLENVNYKANYPIMIQLLFNKNYKITDRIDRNKMKDYEIKIPTNIDYKK